MFVHVGLQIPNGEAAEERPKTLLTRSGFSLVYADFLFVAATGSPLCTVDSFDRASFDLGLALGHSPGISPHALPARLY